MSERKEKTINAKSLAKLAYGYEFLFQTLCHIAGTSGERAQWYVEKSKEATVRIDPLWKLTEKSNAYKPGDCLSQYEPFAEWAADVEKKSETLERCRQEVGKLHSKIQLLQDALKPFSDLADAYDEAPPARYFGDTEFRSRYSDDDRAILKIKLLRNAREAMGIR